MMSTHSNGTTRFITLGNGANKPAGKRKEFHTLEELINLISVHGDEWPAIDATLSCSTYKDDRRNGDNFEALQILHVDVDHKEKKLVTEHPAWGDFLPCSLFHTTPHGVRFFLLPDAPITNKELAKQFLTNLGLLFEQIIQEQKLSEFKVDMGATTDFARFYWPPNAHVVEKEEPEPRQGQFTIIRHAPFSRDELLLLFRKIKIKTPEPSATQKKEHNPNSPASKWKKDHPVDWKAFNTICPVCENGENSHCFSAGLDDVDAGYCFSANHKEDAERLGRTHIGKLSPKGGYIIDALDLEANKRGMSVTDILAADGYNVNADVSPNVSPKTVKKFSEIEMKETNWLWEERIKLGAATLIAGPPGVGKSTICVDLISRWSSGRPLPEQTKAPQTYKVLMMALEDEEDEIVKPRLVVAGANLENVYHLSEDDTAFDVKTDLKDLEDIIVREDIKILYIDSLGILFKDKDVNSYTDCYALLTPFKKLAAKLKIAVLFTYHTKKSKETTALDSILGSRALTGVVRSALIVENTQEEGKKAVAIAKMNHALKADSIGFTLNNSNGVPLVMWGGKDPSTGDDLVSGSSKAKNIQAGVEWLQALFADGQERKPRDVEKLLKEDRDAAFSFSFLRQWCVEKAGLVREGPPNSKVWKPKS